MITWRQGLSTCSRTKICKGSSSAVSSIVITLEESRWRNNFSALYVHWLSIHLSNLALCLQTTGAHKCVATCRTVGEVVTVNALPPQQTRRQTVSCRSVWPPARRRHLSPRGGEEHLPHNAVSGWVAACQSLFSRARGKLLDALFQGQSFLTLPG